MHALSGCDTVPKMNGIGNITALMVLNFNSLESLGKLDEQEDQVLQESKKFVSACYGIADSTDMTEIRYIY